MLYHATVSVTQLVDDASVHPLDRQECLPGEYPYAVEASSEEEACEHALDRFHENVPVKVLDHYTIDAVAAPYGIGALVKVCRENLGLTQAKLAHLAYTTQANVCSIEHGKRAIGKRLAVKLGKALGVDYKVFL